MYRVTEVAKDVGRAVGMLQEDAPTDKVFVTGTVEANVRITKPDTWLVDRAHTKQTNNTRLALGMAPAGQKGTECNLMSTGV